MPGEIVCRRTDETNEQQVRSAMDAQQNSTAARHLQVIYTDIAQRVHAVTAARPIWPCHKGCDGCCCQLARPPEMMTTEWQVVYQDFLQLSPATQHEVARRIRALADWQDGPVTCRSSMPHMARA